MQSSINCAIRSRTEADIARRCGAPPGAALADSGFFSIHNLNQMEQRNIDAYLPDLNMARALNLGARCRTVTPYQGKALIDRVGLSRRKQEFERLGCRPSARQDSDLH